MSILAVNFGGLALVRRLRRQLKESVEFVAFSGLDVELDHNVTVGDTSGLGTCAVAAPEGESPSSSTSCTLGVHRAVSEAAEGGEGGPPIKVCAGRAAPDVQLARGGPGGAARAQARRVLVLQKAMRDLQTVRRSLLTRKAAACSSRRRALTLLNAQTALHIAFVSTCLLVTSAWIVYCAATDRVTSADWA